MSTLIRAAISEKNKYWIDKHRHYELKHFCLQYPEWKRAYDEHSIVPSVSNIDWSRLSGGHSDPTAKKAMSRYDYLERIKTVELAARNTDDILGDYILKAVTEGLSYTYLSTILQIPCSRDLYYDRYRKFFWLLDKLRK